MVWSLIPLISLLSFLDCVCINLQNFKTIRSFNFNISIFEVDATITSSSVSEILLVTCHRNKLFSSN